MQVAVNHHRAGRLQQAEKIYREVLALEPNHAGALQYMGVLASLAGKPDLATVLIRRAIAINPSSEEAYNNLGGTFYASGQIDEAIEAWREALKLDPHNASTHSNLLFALHYHPDYDARAILDESLRWARTHVERLCPKKFSHVNDPNPNRRLRIGYVSPDFYRHVIGRSIRPVFKHRDRDLFENFCYSDVEVPDSLTEEFRGEADHWREIRNVSDEKVAEWVHADRIDILVDLSAHSACNRLLMFGRKPAPIQVSYLAYCGTTGMKEIDYRLSDPYLDPSESELECYIEKTIRLPHSYWYYQPLEEAPGISPLPALSANHVTFGCLSNIAKVSPITWELWMELLASVPGAHLLIHVPEGARREALGKSWTQRGFSPERLEFVGTQPWQQYLENWQRCDLGLDPFPFGGGITTCDALWMGVPVITLSGRTAVGRGGRSILSNIGLPELIAETPRQYLEIAASLAADLPRLCEMRLGLRDRMEQSPLRDARNHTREIEAAYREIWKRWCEGKTMAG